MAFNWLKKIIVAPVKAGAFLVRTISPVVKPLQPILSPIYESIVPQPIKKVVKTIARLGPVVKLINSIRRDEPIMEQFSTALTNIVRSVLSLRGKSGMDLAFGIGLLMQSLMSLINLAKRLPESELITASEAALDAMTGTDPGALIGPAGELVQIDIPYIDDEKLYDLITSGARDALTAPPE